MSDCNDELTSSASMCTLDEKQTGLLSVSVTFKEQEILNTEINSVSEISGKSKEDDDSGQSESASAHEESTSTSEEKGNGSLSSKHKTGANEVEVTRFDFLSGWKGYSNNIYIEPIIINKSTSYENCSLFESMQSRKLTAEDKRKQLRLRQASEWVTKHNQRIHFKESLKTGFANEDQKSQSFSRCPSSTTSVSENRTVRFQGKNKLYHSDRKPVSHASRLAKGFVCRHWARDYLSKENERYGKEEPGQSSLTIRPYVNVHMTRPLCKTQKAIQYKLKKSVKPESDNSKSLENVTENTRNSNEEKSYQKASRMSSLSSIQLKETLQEDMTDFILQNISVDVRNPCEDVSSISKNENGEGIRSRDIFKSIANSGQEKTKLRNKLKPNEEQKKLNSVPLKEFPPIDPLRGLKFSSLEKTTTLEDRKFATRPHSMNTSFSSIQENMKKELKNRRNINRASSSSSMNSCFYGVYGKAATKQIK